MISQSHVLPTVSRFFLKKLSFITSVKYVYNAIFIHLFVQDLIKVVYMLIVCKEHSIQVMLSKLLFFQKNTTLFKLNSWPFRHFRSNALTSLCFNILMISIAYICKSDKKVDLILSTCTLTFFQTY